MRAEELFHFLKTMMIGVFLIQTTLMPVAFAQGAPGPVSVAGEAFRPLILQGVNIYPNDPFLLKFIVDKGDSQASDEDLKKESERLIKYFLAALTVPEKEMWVNLSPYEKNRIIPDGFGKTTMGHDLLAQDYVLKQMASALMNPDKELGQKFWSRVYSQAKEQFGTTEIPMDTFNKVWIVPEGSVIYEHEKGAFIIKSHLKVMQEEDYLALEANKNSTEHGLGNVAPEDLRKISKASAAIMREILIPEITREVNEGKAFANLRQIYHSLLLANWYKKRLQESLLAKVYGDKSKTSGVDIANPAMNQKVYDQYVAQFKAGAFNYIKEDVDPVTQEITPRKYFSGGADFTRESAMITKKVEKTKIPRGQFVEVDARLASASLTRRGFLKTAFLGLAGLAAAPMLKHVRADEPTPTTPAAAARATKPPTYAYPVELKFFGDNRVLKGTTRGWPLTYLGEEVEASADWPKTGTKMEAVLDYAFIQQQHGDFTIIASLMGLYKRNGLFFFQNANPKKGVYTVYDDQGKPAIIVGLPLETPRILKLNAKDNWWKTWDYGVNAGDTANMINLAVDASKKTKNVKERSAYLAFAKRLAMTLSKLEDKSNGGFRYAPMGVYYNDNGSVDKNYFYNLKTTESNLKALNAYLNLYAITQDETYRTTAVNTWQWLRQMYLAPAANVFYEAERFISDKWEKSDLGTDKEQFKTTTTADMPIPLMINDLTPDANDRFGADPDARKTSIREMVAAIDRRTAFYDEKGNIVGYALSDEMKGSGLVSPVATCKMAQLFRRIAKAYETDDPDMSNEFNARADALLVAARSYFSWYKETLIAPNQINFATRQAAAFGFIPAYTAYLGSGTALYMAQNDLDMQPEDWSLIAREQAMALQENGGIDLNPVIDNAKIVRNAQGVIIPVAEINKIDGRILSKDFSGFMPIILQMKPVADLSTLVGTQ